MTRAVPTPYPIIRAALFRLPAETAHEVVLGTLARLPRSVRGQLRRRVPTDERLRVRAFGIDFPNPIGMAAGFDKDGVAFNSLAALGFGFVEIGTVTALAQPGNPRPRLFRLTEERALLNRMGFNNTGAKAVAERLATTPIETIVGVNVGKSKVTPLDAAAGDYLRSIELLEPYARYIVINVSSPNTPGLRELQGADRLRDLLEAIRRRRPPSDGSGARPILLKLSPDLGEQQLDQAIDIATECGVAGLIAVNTTIDRSGLRVPASRLAELGEGGISGAPLRTRARDIVAHIHRRTGGALPIIGVGGIFDAETAWDRIRAGASLVQIYTGLIYEGPGVVRRIARGILDRMEAEGFDSLADAVGTSTA